ncbi:Membrane protein involved in the export of O-antigen and teichoic acid [Marinobacter antarcticus]|uniref:Membrane protein involved in the export of O-antigen and teichoic acid n=1 Tax=Marinobacter antarcticus TaxID=564117 RepID=A0A1M6RWB3_9GAMM|nr:lipopolysaccharide biosynthesis protein [Marinobacter antarcticus]SHK36741.1 Membrane protein involved in the export of O-antigen and teichoic acid [Marinobacter antarcticus]
MTPKQIAAFAIGPIGGAVLGLISLPVITWFFSQEDVGRMAMLQVTLGFSILLFSLGLDQSYVREFHEAENKPALLKRAMLPGLILLLITVLVLLSFGGSLADWLFDVPHWHLSVLVGLALMVSYISRFLSLVLRMNERGLAFSMSQLLPKLLLLAIIGSYVAIGVDKSLTNLVLANVTSITFVCAIYGWNTRAEWLAGISSKLDINQLKSMLQFGMPLILGGLAFWGLTAIDKVFLRTLASFEELGVYSIAVSFAGAAAILQSVFSVVWAPTVYKWASTGQGLEKVHKVSRYILALVVLGFSLAGLLSWTVTLFLPANYAAVQWIVVSCIGFPLLYTLSETTVVGIGISRRSSFSMLAAGIAFAVNLAGNWWLIPIYGAAGAAVSTCVSFWVFFVLRTEFSIYVWKSIPRVLMYTYTMISVSGAVVFTLWGEVLGCWMVGFWVLVLGSWVVIFRGEVREVIGFFRNKVSRWVRQ